MSKIDNLNQELCPDGVEYKHIDEIIKLKRGIRVVKKDLSSSTGYPVYQNSLSPLGYFDKYNQSENTPFIICAGAAGEVGFSKEKYWGADDCFSLICPSDINPRYLFHVLLKYQSFLKSRVRKASVPRLSKKVIEQLLIPVPPIEVQEEIVRVLDSFAQLEAQLEAELEARRRQYYYFRSDLLNLKGSTEVSWVSLGDLGSICMCKRIFKEETSPSEEIPFYKIGTFGGEPDSYISKELFEAYREKYSYPKKGDILISCSGTIGRSIVFDGKPSYFQDSNIVWVDNDESKVLNSFLRQWYAVIEWPTSKGGTIGRLYTKDLKKIKVPILPLSEQQRIVDILNKFDVLVNDISEGLPAEIEARRKQYEYYRDKLLTFKKKEN